MPIDLFTAFVSYSREDAEEFALRLAADLKKAGASIWLDQLELEPGKPWDTEIERALAVCPRMLAILSPRSVSSANVLDEINYALRRDKTVIPILYLECEIPFRLDRLERIDFCTNYDRGLNRLLKTLGVQTPPAASAAAAAVAVPSATPPTISEEERKVQNLERCAETGGQCSDGRVRKRVQERRSRHSLFSQAI